jgi:hypothetical protein
MVRAAVVDRNSLVSVGCSFELTPSTPCGRSVASRTDLRVDAIAKVETIARKVMLSETA